MPPSYALIPANSTLIGPHARQQLLVENVVDGRFAGDRTAAGQILVQRSRRGHG